MSTIAETGRVGAAIRGEFPILATTAYLNACSQGALSHRVRAAYEEYLAGWDANGAEWEFWVERAEAARAGFAELLHGQPDEVAVTTSVSQGVSGIVSALPFERGGRNRIVISEYEFPTVGQIAHAQELRGAEVVHVRPEADGSIPAEKFAEAIDERTALVCCTTISYRTGHRNDVAAIAEAAHAQGALVLADSYQAAGGVRGAIALTAERTYAVLLAELKDPRAQLMFERAMKADPSQRCSRNYATFLYRLEIEGRT